MFLDRINNLKYNHGFKKYLLNTVWLLITQGFRLVSGFFVGLWLARYLGPTDYGIYNYIIAILSVLLSINMFGTEDIVVKNLIERKIPIVEQLSTAFYLRAIIAIIITVILLIYYLFTKSQNSLYLLFCSPALVFQAGEVIDLYYRAKIKVKISSAIRIFQITFSALIKIYFILTEAEVAVFLYLFVFDVVTYVIPTYIFYLRFEQDFILKKPTLESLISLFKQCVPIMTASVLAITLSKIEIFFIINLLGAEEAGIYSAAFKIIELGFLIPTLILASLFTAIINGKSISQKEYLLRFQNLNRILIYFGFSFSFFTSFFSTEIILLLYGENYLEASSILRYLSFHIITLTFMLINTRWFIAENKNKIVLIKMASATTLSLTMNQFLIPSYGLNGAVITSIFTYFIIFYLIDLFLNNRKAFLINSSFWYWKKI